LDAKSSAKILSQHKDKYMKWPFLNNLASWSLVTNEFNTLWKYFRFSWCITHTWDKNQNNYRALVMFVHSETNL
jgi:hypothetical protein